MMICSPTHCELMLLVKQVQRLVLQFPLTFQFLHATLRIIELRLCVLTRSFEGTALIVRALAARQGVGKLGFQVANLGVELCAQGSVLRGSGNTWPVAMGEQPANRVTRRAKWSLAAAIFRAAPTLAARLGIERIPQHHWAPLADAEGSLISEFDVE